MANEKMFSVDKFLGLNQSGDGDTELRLGEASRMVNFDITDGMNLKRRPGIAPVSELFGETEQLVDVWAGFVGDRERLVLVDFADGQDRITVCGADEHGTITVLSVQTGVLGLPSAVSRAMLLSFSGAVYILSVGRFAVMDQADAFRPVDAYIPLVIAGASPAGGGTELERINLLSPYRRMGFSADGTSTAYILPDEASSVVSVRVDNIIQDSPGIFDPASHTFTFTQAPVKGVGNVEITYGVDQEAAAPAALQILSCTLHEEFNGSTDTRLFLAGDGSNRCYYSGITQDGQPSPLYFPALNEIAVDMSGSAVTALARHYSRLMVFKPDGTFAITYEPVTLADGSVTAGFYIRPVNREYGNSAPGQVRTVTNYPRSFTSGAIYEWRVTNSYYRDERYAVRISDPVRTLMRAANPLSLLAWDDDVQKTYYVFLNDDRGTVIVNRYGISKSGIWYSYQSKALCNVSHAFTFGGNFYFCVNGKVMHFQQAALYDIVNGQNEPVTAVWESGFMSFGADFLRKYASEVYMSILPEANSSVYITAETDRRSEYTEKNISKNVFLFTAFRFSSLTFRTKQAPGISRIRLKVKKFVYYKLKISVSDPGTTGTVLGFDMEVRYGAKAK